ncbi:unnamed protein product, partial [Ascophyllum nodosum]
VRNNITSKSTDRDKGSAMAYSLRPRKEVDYKDPGELTLTEIRSSSGASSGKALGETPSSKRRRPTAHPSTSACGLSAAPPSRAARRRRLLSPRIPRTSPKPIKKFFPG